MSSDTAMKKHHGSVAEYRASEGKTITIPYRGDVNGTVQDILGGIRSACTYTGSKHLKELAKRATFIRVTQQTNDMTVGKFLICYDRIPNSSSFRDFDQSFLLSKLGYLFFHSSLFPSPVLSLSLDVIRGGRKLRESDMGKKGKLRNNNKAKKKKKKKK
uniref:GMP reductase n=1 Tax=Caenorhabditis japonica TaxID=281687 RepID=A0A8R1EEK6_CAEJA